MVDRNWLSTKSRVSDKVIRGGENFHYPEGIFAPGVVKFSMSSRWRNRLVYLDEISFAVGVGSAALVVVPLLSTIRRL